MAYQMPNACHHHRAGAALVSLSDWWLLRTSDYLMIGPYVYPDLPFTNAGAAFHFLLCSLCGCFRQIQWRSPVSPATGNTGLALPMCGTCIHTLHTHHTIHTWLLMCTCGNSMPLPDIYAALYQFIYTMTMNKLMNLDYILGNLHPYCGH